MEEESRGQSKVRTDSEQESCAAARAVGSSSNRSVTVGVRTTMTEFTEATPVFWTLQEVRHRHACTLMNQGLSEATFKVDNHPPIPLRIDHVHIPEFDIRFSPAYKSYFREDVIASFPEYYSSWEEGTRAIVERQEAIFRTSLSILKPKTALSEPRVIEGSCRDDPRGEEPAGDPDESGSADNWNPFSDV